MRDFAIWALAMVATVGLVACTGRWTELPASGGTPQPNQAAASAAGQPSSQGGLMPQSAYRVEWSSPQIPSQLPRGAQQLISVSIRNTGDREWDARQISVSYHWFNATENRMVDQYDGIRSPIPSNIRPGQEVTIDNVKILGPNQGGSYLLQLTLVQESVTWFETQGADTLTVPITVQ